MNFLNNYWNIMLLWSGFQFVSYTNFYLCLCFFLACCCHKLKLVKFFWNKGSWVIQQSVLKSSDRFLKSSNLHKYCQWSRHWPIGHTRTAAFKKLWWPAATMHFVWFSKFWSHFHGTIHIPFASKAKINIVQIFSNEVALKWPAE